MSYSRPSVYEDNRCGGDDDNLGGDDRLPGIVVDNKSKNDESIYTR